ncbi:hypothetical protein AVEN_120766-1, partial [Araneus ventricosus]
HVPSDGLEQGRCGGGDVDRGSSTLSDRFLSWAGFARQVFGNCPVCHVAGWGTSYFGILSTIHAIPVNRKKNMSVSTLKCCFLLRFLIPDGTTSVFLDVPSRADGNTTGTKFMINKSLSTEHQTEGRGES